MDVADDDDFATMASGNETTEAEKEYERILEDLRDAEGMKVYADVYTKLFDSYFALKDENREKQEEIAGLHEKISRFDSTLEQYIAELKDSNKTIEKLRADIEEARALADAMHSRELASVESLETMKKNVARLEKELDARKRVGDEDAGATSAVKEKERFEKEIARLTGELDVVKQRLANSASYVEELEQKNNAAEESIARLAEQLEEADNNAVRTSRLVDHLKSEGASMKLEIDHRGHSINELTDKVSRAERAIEKRDKQLRDINSRVEAAQQGQEAATAKAAQLRQQLDRANAELDKSKQAVSISAKQVKNMTSEVNKLKAEVAKWTKQEAQQVKKYQLLEQTKSTVEQERNQLRQQVSVMEREILQSKKQAEVDRREIENMNREKEIITKNMQKIQSEAMENLQMMNRQQQRQQQLEHELQQAAAATNRQRLALTQLEKDKDRMLEESIALNEKIDDLSEEVRLRNADILDLNKALREASIRERKVSVALDSSRAERNVLHKNHTEALDEIQDLKQKIKMLAYQIEQLKEDITGKEVGLKSSEGALLKCNKRVELLRLEVQGGQTRLAEAKAEIAAAKQEEGKLNRIIQDGDAARAKLSKELEGLVNERDVVGAQLVRRNDEIALLYEKIRILEVTLHRGERQYASRVEDIRLLRLEILRLRKEKNLLSKGIENMTDLRLEVFNLERELCRCRLRARALEQALATPLNVHRWRKLHATDPRAATLAAKLRATHKKVVSQSEQLVLKERQVTEMRQQYEAVKDMLALQPSPDLQQELSKTQRVLAQRTTKMKCLVAELSMRERQVTDLRLEVDRINAELTSFKQKYYDMKRVLDADEARRLKTPVTPASAAKVV
ncbi:cilia- and flagella-associated protein 58-like [Aricia agestis]|uniref:cilia- and flagella-associated protein 58-like n=1 Tax=Aricia agestis TaxID=91739 RepID=UPI001C20B23F|nr:cilia- and flagella-associated protein 58-like [Aricia agestis]